MIQIHCPFCGPRDQLEFAYGSDASITYPALDASLQDWHDAVFLRDNVCGVQRETWHHVLGCRSWLVVERDTLTHEVHKVMPAHPGLVALAEAWQ